MTNELIPVSFNKILQSRSYTVIILSTDNKKFAIYAEPKVGQNIQKFLIEKYTPRPLTHSLLQTICKELNIKILQIVIQAVEDTVYFARLFLEQDYGDKKTIIEMDARPSDCIILALMNNTPLYCRKEVLEKAIAVEE